MSEALDQIQEARPRRFRPYPEYSDSGVEWLGKIPAHWETKTLKFISELQTGLTIGKRFEEGRRLIQRPYLRVANVQDGYLDLSDLAEVEIPAADAARYELQSGDVLLTEGGDFDKLGRGHVWADQVAGCLHQNHIFAVRPQSELLDSRFLALVMSSGYGRAYFTATSKQSTNLASTNSTKLRTLPVPLPSVDEQRAVASFLDRETAKIDALVAKKERLIELLQEKRTALITRAVTRGLDPNVPMKDSGVEWLGEIPAHWEVKPLKSLSILQTGLTLGKSYVGQTTTRPYLRVANVQDGYLALDDVTFVDVSVRDVGRFELRMGDVLMTEGGDFDKLGRGHVWEEQIPQCLHQNHIFAVRPRRDALRPYYLALTMGSTYGRAYFTATSKQSTNLASTNSRKLRNLPMPLPQLDEQAEIIRWTNRETTKIDGLIAKIREAVERLKEFRTALISAAVTGKIDVREEAP